MYGAGGVSQCGSNHRVGCRREVALSIAVLCGVECLEYETNPTFDCCNFFFINCSCFCFDNLSVWLLRLCGLAFVLFAAVPHVMCVAVCCGLLCDVVLLLTSYQYYSGCKICTKQVK